MDDTTSDTKADTSLRQIRIRYSAMETVEEDEFMRYQVMLLNRGDKIRSLNNPGHAARIFIDTGVNVNTISRKFRQYLLDHGLRNIFIPGPEGGLMVTLAGGHQMRVTGDMVCIMVEVSTTFELVVEEVEFLIIDDDTEDLVMGVT
jgi:hypothetical protein